MVTSDYIKRLNKDIEKFPNVFPITPDMKITHKGVSRLIMLERYTTKDIEKATLRENDMVVLTIKEDTKFPARGVGIIKEIDWENHEGTVLVEEEFRGQLDDPEESKSGMVTRNLDLIDKPLELFYEQIAKRNAWGLAQVEETEEKRQEWFEKFYEELVSLNFIPAGRVLYGAGTGKEVTYFNCYVMPYPKDSRDGLAKHRQEVMEIMSRGGGVGTNGTTLRPRNAIAKGVNGKSSGAVSWLDDIAKLTHLVEQGGSRRGAQMVMMADFHPDIIEFIISKMQNPKILQYIIATTKDKQIKQTAKNKLKFVPLTQQEIKTLEAALKDNELDKEVRKEAEKKLNDGGTYTVNNPDFLSGANISVTLTDEFMEAVEKNRKYALRFPDLDNYTPEEKKFYDENWHKHGDVREWEALGYKVKTYRTIKAKDLWNLINVCATYSAEPGIFFMDNANSKTNAKAYGQKVVATNPCGKMLASR